MLKSETFPTLVNRNATNDIGTKMVAGAVRTGSVKTNGHLRNNSTCSGGDSGDATRLGGEQTNKNGLTVQLPGNGNALSPSELVGVRVVPRANDDNNNRHNNNTNHGTVTVKVNSLNENQDGRSLDVTTSAPIQNVDLKESISERGRVKILEQFDESDEEEGDSGDGEGGQEKDVVKEDSRPLAPEGGWGWMVVFAGFVIYWLVPGMIRSYGAVYMELLETFPDCTASEAGWIPALLSSISIGLAPISAVMGKMYTCRNVVFVGGLLCSLGLSLSYFATSIFYLYISFGLITGIGAGLCTTPSVIVLNQYFVKKRALASGICLSGAAVGSFTIPIFVKYIVAEYKFRGTLLIMGAITLHVCACSLLFTPNGKWEMKEKKNKKTTATSATVDGASRPLILTPAAITGGDKVALAEKQLSGQLTVKTESESRNLYLRPPPRASSFVVSESVRRRMDSDRMSLNNSRLVAAANGAPAGGGDKQSYQLIAMTTSLSSVSAQQRARKLSSSMSHSVNDISTVSVYYDADSSSDDDDDVTNDGQQKSDAVTAVRKKATFRKVCRRVGAFFKMCCDFTLFREYTYTVTTITGCCIAGAFPHVLFFVPVFAQQMGFSKVDASMLLSICSAVDIVSRISYGWFMDLGIIKRCHGLAISCAVCGIGTLCIPLANSYILLAFFVCLYGFGSGTAFMLLPVILADNHGVAKLPSTYGLMRLFQGAIMLVIPPFAGFLKDTTGIYEYCFLFMGGMLCCGSITMLIIPLAQKRDLRKGFVIPEM